MTPSFKEIGPALRWLRERRGLSLAEVARRADLAPSSLSRFERGKRQPTLDTLGRVLRVLQADPIQLAFALRFHQRCERELNLPEGLTDRESFALAVAAHGFQDFIEAAARRFAAADPSQRL